jgi:CO/xanthine dehydrogenase Mo-binding subunit
MEPVTTRKWIGRSIRRIEDPKLLVGRAGYVDDISLPGMLHVAVVRSPFPHARILGIDTSRAQELPGVHAVITGAEAADLCGPLPSGPLGDQMPFRCLAVDKVRYVGEGILAIAADSRYVAEDACGLIEVDYDPLDAVVDPQAATAPGAPVLHEAFGSNLVYEREFTFGDVDDDFARADRVVRDRLRLRRSGAQPLETVGAVADFDPVSGMLTIWANSKILPHRIFHLAEILGVPSNRINSIPIPAGGSFGSKDTDKVIVIAAMMAKVLGRPVKYVEDRLENITNSDSHGPDRWYEAELALKNDGTISSMRVAVTEDYGAYFGRGTSHHSNALAQVVGPYRIGSVAYRIRGVLTNKCQQGAYRGYGAAEANWMLERMVDLAARELDLDPAEIRRRNFIGKDQFPYKIPTGNLYDSGDYHQVLDRVLEIADYGYWRESSVGCGGWPLHRDRRRVLPAADRLQLDRDVVPRQAGRRHQHARRASA